MPIRVLLRDSPHRALALVAGENALVFKHTHSGTDPHGSVSSVSSLVTAASARPSLPPRCIAEFGPEETLDLHGYRAVTSALGTLGLITLNNDVFLCAVTGAIQVANPRPEETIQKIHSVEFYCLNRSDYDNVRGYERNPYPGQDFIADDVEFADPLDNGDIAAEHPFHAIKKLLSGGNFYYSTDFDLTSRLQDRIETKETVDLSSLDEGLFWNSYMINPLLQFRNRLTLDERRALDKSRILTTVIRGFVKTLPIPSSSAPFRKHIRSDLPCTLTLISRLSCRRAGTRFNSRGIDDEGNVANFVETETILWSPSGVCFSYTQVRGSIPVFWESSTSLIPGQQKIHVTRSAEATQPAFDRHFENLKQTYGNVHIVNLLSATKPGEVELTNAYNDHLDRSPLRSSEKSDGGASGMLRVTEFDFHAEARVAGGYDGARHIRPFIETSADQYGYFMLENVVEELAVRGSGDKKQIVRPTVILQQEGVFRTNCLDCLDRTNLIQTLISQLALESFLVHRSENTTPDFWTRHSSLWADNGDTLSKIYAGTGALKSSYTRHGKMNLAGAIADVRKSATRLYVNNFADKGRQNTTDLLLGRLIGQAPVHLFDPINDFVQAEMKRREPEYTTSRKINIWCGTFNLNGKTTGASEDLWPWFHPIMRTDVPDPEIVAVGFQEIVELSPSQIMNTDPTRRHIWEAAVKRGLNLAAADGVPEKEQDDYIMLRSGQLVGAALMIFVKASILPAIKNVEGATKKTGVSGLAGNKGAVAIRMDLADTSICFLTAHLAAGFGNYDERNRDYRTISQGLRFLKNRGIEDHDTIVWMGDFNYRIGLSHEKATDMVKSGDIARLYQNDQLNIQMVAGMAFQFYNEGKIDFLPTYKFDIGTDNYDSSEKNRIPAWCDRVVWKGDNLKQLSYGVAPLRFSDHRPVSAIFECQLAVVDEAAKRILNQHLYEKRKRDLDRQASKDGAEDSEDDLDAESDGGLMGYESIAPGLPPASSDRKKWWIDNGKAYPAKSQIGPPKDTMVPNPARTGNPWRDSGDEPDWIEIDRPRSTPGGGSFADGTKIKPATPPPRRSGRAVPPAWEGNRKLSNGSLPPSRSVGDGLGIDGVFETKKQTPPPPPARTASIASVVSSAPAPTIAARKPPPIVPKKPVALTGTSTSPELQRSTSPATSALSKELRSSFPMPLASSRQGASGAASLAAGRLAARPHAFSNPDPPPPSLPKRTNTSSSLASSTSTSTSTFLPPPIPPNISRRQVQVPPPVQARRVGALSQIGRQASSSSTPSSRIATPTPDPDGKTRTRTRSVDQSWEKVEKEEVAPALPPRRPTIDSQLGLMDQENGSEMKDWKTLQPS